MDPGTNEWLEVGTASFTTCLSGPLSGEFGLPVPTTLGFISLEVLFPRRGALPSKNSITSC